MLNKYIDYLNVLNKKLTKYFEIQAPYIACKKGCAKCCQNGEYPFSEIEFNLLRVGFSLLDKQTQDKIVQNIQKIKEAQKKSTQQPFLYECPFLLNNECSVYKYRGIICRTFGLIAIKKGENSKIPFCVNEGLNYSKVFDKSKSMISMELFEQSGETVEPVAYNVNYDFLTSEEIEEACDIKFGEKKALIDWL